MANTKGVADHKAANTTTIPGLTVERTKSIVLLIVQLFSVVQTGLSIAGISQPLSARRTTRWASRSRACTQNLTARCSS